MRLRDLNVVIGEANPGRRNAISDVPGVLVGHSTLISGTGSLSIGRGPVRTGVTAVVPPQPDPWDSPLFAGSHVLNGTGEVTGLHYVNETGLLYGPVFLTNSHSIGSVRDAVIRRESRLRGDPFPRLPVVAETYDGLLNDIAGMHVGDQHVHEALDRASPEVEEGCVGGGTGMIAFGFKSGIGTSSRVVEIAGQTYHVGVLVQPNNGSRRQLSVHGIPVGRLVSPEVVPLPAESFDRDDGPSRNSIQVILATDIPLLPHQLDRVAQRATLGVAGTGATAHQLSGDFALAFSTANAGAMTSDFDGSHVHSRIHAASNAALNPAFDAAVEATTEAIVNALLAAKTMTGVNGHTAHALSSERLLAAISEHGRELLGYGER